MKNKQIQVYSYQLEGVYGPPTLYGATLVAVNNKLYLYGGKCSSINPAVYEFNLELHTWKKIDSKKISGLHILFNNYLGRFFHQAVNFNNNLLCFGGEINYNERIKMRECTYETTLYNTAKEEWQKLSPKNTP